MKHFLEISQLSRQQLESLVERAFYFKKKPLKPTYPNQSLAILFYEASTRTRLSFELAAKQLAMNVVNLDLGQSSATKGETIKDTLQTLAAMGIQIFAIRHQEDGMVQRLANDLEQKIHLINAGDGRHAHPSQALLDIMTIMEEKGALSQLKIAIVGDLKHSRVANSFQCISKQLGVGQLILVAPKSWEPETLHYGCLSNQLEDALIDADVIICLRVQKERILDNEMIDLSTYRRDYALTQAKLALAKPNAMVMHPGPINRGMEIDSEVADGPQSYILQQVTNGIYARMAILDYLCS